MKRNHLLTAWIAILCLALLMSGCSLRSRSASKPTPTPAFTVKSMEGVYTEQSGQGGVLQLTALDDANAKIVIDWPTSATQTSHWEMSGAYDAAKNALAYTNAVLTEQTADAQGGKSERIVSSNGSGSFAIGSGKLTWTDDSSIVKGETTDFAYFTSLAAYAQQTAATPAPAASTPAPSASTPAPAATPAPTPAPTPTPTPTPAPTPAPNPADLPVIKKSPTSETVAEGGSCYFAANYQNALWAVWHFVSPDGQTDLTYEEAQERFPDVQILNGMYSQMQLKNISKDLNGWQVYCRYSNRSGAVDTDKATITVTEKVQNDQPVIKKSPTSETVAEGGSCYFAANYENALWAVWHFVSPDGQTDLTYEQAQERFPDVQILNGMYSQMQLKNISLDMNGWKVYCRYSNRSGSADTDKATINVIQLPTAAAPAPVQTPAPTLAPVQTPAPADSSIVIEAPSTVGTATPDGVQQPTQAAPEQGVGIIITG